MRELLPLLAAARIEIGATVVANGARVALGDEIGELAKAGMVAVLIGERPGLSAPDSLGAYLTFAPKLGRTDADRNCVSNVHREGLTYEEAAFKIAWLIREGFARGTSGVALKDESGDRTPHRLSDKSGAA
jgi:ethanolamine ammonia-lyase small subunit